MVLEHSRPGAPTARQMVARGERGAERCAEPRDQAGKHESPEGATEEQTTRTPKTSVALFRAWWLCWCDPGAARSASLRACPWLPSVAPPALAALW
jgi:hypothetical protein